MTIEDIQCEVEKLDARNAVLRERREKLQAQIDANCKAIRQLGKQEITETKAELARLKAEAGR